jgi:hypothetical protein
MKQKDILLILVPSFIVVVAWIIFNIYHSSVSSTISENLNMQIIPISPLFDQKTISAIKKRQQFEPIYQTNTTASIAASPTPQPSPSVLPSSASSSSSPNFQVPSSTTGGAIQ